MNPKDFKIIETFISKSGNQVFLVENINTKQRCVGKVIFKEFSTNDDIAPFVAQLQELQQLENPSICEIIGFSCTNFFNENYPTIFTEYYSNRSLRQFLTNEPNPRELSGTGKYINLLGIAIGMEYLHSHNIIHGHLSPENILLDENFYPHLNDYGFAAFSDEFRSYLYMSPEFLESQKIDTKSDVYSYSLIAYSIITRKDPYDESNLPSEIDKIIKGKRPNLSIIENKKLRELLSKSWSKNSEERPTFSEIISMLLTFDFYSIFQPFSLLVMNFLHFYPCYLEKIKEMKSSIPNEIQKKIDKVSFRVVLIGYAKSGKTALLHTYIKGKKCIETTQTVGVDSFSQKVKIEFGEPKLNLFDTSANDLNAPLLIQYLKEADAFVFCTDVSVRDGFNQLDEWIDFVNNHSKVTRRYLAVTKCDCEWKNNEDELKSFADKNKLSLFFSSCDDLKSIQTMFSQIATELIKSSFDIFAIVSD